jgi:hypothetical protein
MVMNSERMRREGSDWLMICFRRSLKIRLPRVTRFVLPGEGVRVYSQDLIAKKKAPIMISAA